MFCKKKSINLSEGHNYKSIVLTGVAQWVEHQPVNQRITGSIPSLGHMPGLQVRSPVGGAQEATTHCFSPCISPSLPLFLRVNK